MGASRRPAPLTHGQPRRLNVRSLEFVAYGLVVDGSEERARYAHQLQGYQASTLLPIFAGWEGELPSYLQKARLRRTPSCRLCSATLFQDMWRGYRLQT